VLDERRQQLERLGREVDFRAAPHQPARTGLELEFRESHLHDGTNESPRERPADSKDITGSRAHITDIKTPSPGLSSQEETTMSNNRSRVFHTQTATLTTLTILILSLPLGARRMVTAQPGADKSKGIAVDCDAGQSIKNALKGAKPGDTILVAGTCHERVAITQPVTLDGGGTASIDGTGVAQAQGAASEFDGLVVIDGVTNVHLVGLTIQDAATNGIVAAHGAAVELRNITAQNNALTGLVVIDNSTAEAIDCVTRSNRLGFDVVTSSSLVLKGAFTSTSNATNGGDINGESIVELRGAQVTASDNQQFGIIAGSRSSLAIFGWDAAKGSTLTASGNLAAGLGLADSSLTSFSDSVITLTNNGVGLLLGARGHVISPPFASTTFVVQGNAIGMNLRTDSAAFIIGQLTITGNAVAGVLADEASLYLETPSGLSSSVAGNGTNVRLLFGSRSTILNVTIGTPLVCDATVLSRGTTTCP
jgi:hypothetical protein